MSYTSNSYVSSKRPGNLASAFNSDFQLDLGDKFIKLKQQLITEYCGNGDYRAGVEKLKDAWAGLMKELEDETKIIKQDGPNVIPVIEFSTILENNGEFPEHIKNIIRHRGCAIIRGVVQEAQALKWKEDVKDYILSHEKEIARFPEVDSQVWEVYWSKAQVEARSHPNFLMASKAMNKLWHADPSSSVDINLDNCLTYCDRLRIRKDGDESFKLDGHIDGGSVERWEDEEYRKCYKHILKGDWELHDAFDATHRVTANMDLYDCSGGCSMFRTFQGWLSLSHVQPYSGTLRVCPLIKHSTAYLIMRPLLEDAVGLKNFCGAVAGAQQHIVPEFHQPILDNLVSIPEVHPGDCTFWHCDMIQTHDPKCTVGNNRDGSVFYIPTTPECRKNLEYLSKQKIAFIQELTPPDFPNNNCEMNFSDRAFPIVSSFLTKEGQVAMGFQDNDLDN